MSKMKNKKFEEHEIDKNGWTGWITPVHKKYLMKCCDCGLVHEFKFAVVIKIGENDENGNFNMVDVEDKNYRVKMKARRVE